MLPLRLLLKPETHLREDLPMTEIGKPIRTIQVEPLPEERPQPRETAIPPQQTPERKTVPAEVTR